MGLGIGGGAVVGCCVVGGGVVGALDGLGFFVGLGVATGGTLVASDAGVAVATGAVEPEGTIDVTAVLLNGEVLDGEVLDVAGFDAGAMDVQPATSANAAMPTIDRE